ncbi:MAG: hypothetical protein RMK57_12110 [Bryobacterales bacterium]|nr:flagellar hook-length control protein FliK [Bryobacteraceae bacterium]MDW8355265.1 hypothetical protein [Bryobacterales bacterium]
MPADAEAGFAGQLAFAERTPEVRLDPCPNGHAAWSDTRKEEASGQWPNKQVAPPQAGIQTTPLRPASERGVATELIALREPAVGRLDPRAAARAESELGRGAPQVYPMPIETPLARRTDEPIPGAPRPPAWSPAPEPEPASERELRQITLRLDGTRGERVQLHVHDRAGEIRVAVSARDPALAASLREGAAQLVHRLEASGFRAELLPGPGASSAGARWPEPAAPSTLAEQHDGASFGQHRGGDDARQRRNGPHPDWEADWEAQP